MAAKRNTRTAGWSRDSALKRAVKSTELEGGTVGRGLRIRIEKYQDGAITGAELREAGLKRAQRK